MMSHLDFGVNDKTELQEMRDKAVELGAKIAEMQYGTANGLRCLIRQDTRSAL